MENNTQKNDIRIDDDLVHATIKLNVRLFALVMAFIGGSSFFILTQIALSAGVTADTYSLLNLLGIFLPGYEVSSVGAWMGLLWGSILGGVSGAIIYRIYARTIYDQVNEYLQSPTLKESDLEGITLNIGGHSLGLALGSLFSLGLIVMTNWLVIRGTADESYHAKLLSNYLPGYSVSLMGSIIGGIIIFVFIYILCQILSVVYNSIVSIRNKRSA